MTIDTGYPDYARLQRYGGFELAQVSGLQANGATLFTGFVGAWPYLIILTSTFTGPNYARFIITYYTDSTYSKSVGEQVFTRDKNSDVTTQYAVLGPWCKIVMNTDTAGAATLNAFNVYGSYANAGSIRLKLTEDPPWTMDQVFAAGGSATFTISHMMPGPGVFSIYAPVASWSALVSYYSLTAAGFKFYFRVDNSVAANGGTWPLPLPDTTCTVFVHNLATVSSEIRGVWAPAGY